MTTTPHQLELTDVRRSWIDAAIPLVVERIKDGQSFSADNLHTFLPAPEHLNWYGILCASLKRRGLIVNAGYATSTRPERNGAKVGLWKAKA